MHGPGHLLCCGVDMWDEPLACAMWAGHLMATGFKADAEKWAAEAKAKLGKVVVNAYGEGSNRAELRLVGELDKEICDYLMTMVGMYAKRIERKANEVPAAPAVPSIVELPPAAELASA